MRVFGFLGMCLVFLVGTGSSTFAQTFDLVIANSRVIDPETGLDDVRHVGVQAGAIVAVSEEELSGAQVLDVVAPEAAVHVADDAVAIDEIGGGHRAQLVLLGQLALRVAGARVAHRVLLQELQAPYILF